MNTQCSPGARVCARRLVLALAVVAAGLTAATAAPNASAAGRTLNVDATSGKDTNPASATQPLKTLTAALRLAQSGDTVKLAGGGYGPGFSGDQYPAGGLTVRSGVTIVGALDSGFPVSTLLGPGSGAALNLAGNATVRNLALGGQGFGVGLFARQGTQSLSNLFLATRTGASAPLDGLQFSAGLVLRGTAQATLTAGAQQANTTGTTLFVSGATGAVVGQQARLTMRRGQIRLGGSATTGVSVGDQGRFTLDGGRITGPDSNCGLDATGIRVRDVGRATLQNAAQLQDIPGFGLQLDGGAKATITSSTIVRDNAGGCGGRPSVSARDTSSVIAQNASLLSTGGDGVDGISAGGTATLLLRDTEVEGHSGNGIDLDANEKLTFDGGSLAGNGIGIEARTPNDGTGTDKTPRIDVTGVTITGNDIGIQVDEPILKLRDSGLIFNRTGIEVIGAVGGQPSGDSCLSACVNLGFGTDPGNNTFAGNSDTAVRFRPSFDPKQDIAGVPAVGNAWNPNVQGADADGLYTRPLTVRVAGPVADPLTRGSNFVLPLGSNTLIELANASVGAFELSPRSLSAHLGRVARWKLTWTHPVDWKRLNQVVLRLESRGNPVGRIVIDQETRRVRGSGRALRLVREGSSVSRGQAGGKRVTASLTLRIARRYAGRTLVAKVAASDDSGNRQGFRTAGRVRVLAG